MMTTISLVHIRQLMEIFFNGNEKQKVFFVWWKLRIYLPPQMDLNWYTQNCKTRAGFPSLLSTHLQEFNELV